MYLKLYNVSVSHVMYEKIEIQRNDLFKVTELPRMFSGFEPKSIWI